MGVFDESSDEGQLKEIHNWVSKSTQGAWEFLHPVW